MTEFTKSGGGHELTASGGGEITASDGEKGPDPGGGHRSPNLVEEMNSQHLVEEELTASNGERGPDPGGGHELTSSGGGGTHSIEWRKRARPRWRTEVTKSGGGHELTASGGGGTHSI